MDDIVEKAAKVGCMAFLTVVLETASMYGLSYEYPNGNMWETVCVDMSKPRGGLSWRRIAVIGRKPPQYSSSAAARVHRPS